MVEKYLCISYFDRVLGPNLLYSNKTIPNDNGFPDLSKIFDFNDSTGTFVYMHENYQTINHIFTIKSNFSRGNQEFIMISFVIKYSIFLDESIDVFKYMQSKKEILENLAKELTDLKNFDRYLHEEKKKLENKTVNDPCYICFEDFKNIVKKYSELINTKINFKKLNENNELKKIFILGPGGSGKRTFLDRLKSMEIIRNESIDIPLKIYEILIENTVIIAYECVKMDFDCYQCNLLGGCVSNAQGYIYITNSGEKGDLNDVEEFITKVRSFHMKDPISIAIIGNNHDSESNIHEKSLFDLINQAKYTATNIKLNYFLFDIMRSEEDAHTKVLNWLIKSMF